jgi:hypothetical protein
MTFAKRLGLLSSISSTLLAAPLTAAQVSPSWVATYDVPGVATSGDFVARDGAGNVIVAGVSARTSDDADVLVLKYDAAGAIIGSQLVGAGRVAYFNPTGLTVDAAGNVVITGIDSVQGDFSRGITVALAADGTELWRKVYDTPGAYDTVVGLAMTPTGGVIVAGTTEVPSPTSTQQNIFIISYAANGAVLWQDTYDNGSDQENAYDLVRDTSSGALYVVGGVSGKNGGTFVIRWDADGRRRWAKRFGVRGAATFGEAAVVVPGGDVVVAGFYSVPPIAQVDLQVMKVQGSSGRLQWSSLYGDATHDERVVDLAADATGNVYVGGTAFGISSDVDRFLLKFTPTGSQAWAVVDNPFGDYDATAALAVDPSGGAYITGISGAYDGTTYDIDWMTRKYDANGVAVWTAIYEDGPNSSVGDAPHDMILVNGAGPIITGAVRGDATTLAYGAP